MTFERLPTCSTRCAPMRGGLRARTSRDFRSFRGEVTHQAMRAKVIF